MNNSRLKGAINDSRRKLNIDRRIGYLGDGSGEVHDRTRPGNYWVRYDQGGGTLSAPVSLPCEVNANLPTSDGLAVEIGERHKRPIILGAHYEGLEVAGINPLQINPADAQVNKFINQNRITTFQATRHADTTNKPFYAVVLSGWYFDGSATKQYFAGNEIDLSSLQPSSGEHCYAAVFLKTTDGTLEAFASTAVDVADPIGVTDILEAVASKTSGSLDIWAWELRGDDTELTVDEARYLDLRHLFDALVSSLPASSVIMPTVGTPDYNNLEQAHTIEQSSGVIDTTITYITEADSTHIDVAAGQGLIRTTNSLTGDLVFCEWPASTNVAIPAGSGGVDSVRYVGIEYNSGTPQVTIRTSFDWNWYDDFPLGRVSQDGTTLRIINAYAHASDTANKTRQYLRLIFPYERTVPPEGAGGLVVADLTGQYITMSGGTIWHGYNEYSISAIDTSGSDTFDLHYRNGSGGFTHVTSQTTWPNTQYDDGSGTLATMTAARYASLWIYLDVSDGSIDVLYGREENAVLANAQDEQPPTTVPGHISAHGLLIGRFIFQKSDTSATLVQSVWIDALGVSGGGGASALDDLSDVQITSVAQGDILTRKATLWENVNVPEEAVVARVTGADVAPIAMSASTILARLASGSIVAATVAQIKTLLALVVADVSGAANTALSNLASVAINASLEFDTDNTYAIGTSPVKTAAVHTNLLNLEERSAPSSPSSGDIYVYVDTNHNVRQISSLGQDDIKHRGNYAGFYSVDTTTAEETMCTFTMKAGSLGAYGVFGLDFSGVYKNTSGSARNITIRAYVGGTGGTKVFDSG